MKLSFVSILMFVAALALVQIPASAKYPEPNPYPLSWELAFEHGMPKRVVVQVPGQAAPQAFWYMTYRVTNNTNDDLSFIPDFQLLMEDGKVYVSDDNISPRVFDEIKKREGNKYLEPVIKVSGTLRVGEDQAKDGVAIWREPNPEMGHFSIFVGNLSGEAVILKKVNGEWQLSKGGEDLVGAKAEDITVLRKTLQLNYFIRGDEVYPGEDEVNENPTQWIMR